MAHRRPPSPIIFGWYYESNKKSWSTNDVGSKAGPYGLGYKKKRQVLGHSYIPSKGDLFEDFKTIAFTKSSALAQRLLLAIQKQYPNSVVEHCARLLWRRFFTEHKSIFGEEDLQQVLKRLPDCKEDTLLKVAVTEEVKTALRTNTDEALAHGCFGAPWIHVRRSANEIEPFFGSDRLPLIGHLIGQEFQGPLTQYASCEQKRTTAG